MDNISIGYLLVSLIVTFTVISSGYISLNKDEWKCSQSRILDPNDVDKIECIVYKKVIE